MNATDQLDIRRCAAKLEANIEAQTSFRSFTNFEDLVGLSNIYGNRFFAIDVLAGSDHRVEMLCVKPWRC